jgi:WD40 repeat protein
MLLAKGLRDDPSEEVLISGGGDGAIKIWSLAKKGGAISELHRLDDGRDEGESVLSLALDGLFLYSGRLSGEINVWDLETKQLVRSLKAQTDDVLALSVGGGYLFCAGVTGVVEVCVVLLPGVQLLMHRRNTITNTRECQDSKPTMVGYWHQHSRSPVLKTSTSLEETTILLPFGMLRAVFRVVLLPQERAMVCSSRH